MITSLADEEIAEQGGLPTDVAVFHKPVRVAALLTMLRAYHDGWLRQRQTIS